MARIRGLKHDLYKDEDLAELPIEARYLFAGLWTIADREGRLEYRPKRIKAELYPYDDIDVEKLCAKLDAPDLHGRPEKRFIIIYEAAGEQYIQICNFSKHQRPHHAEKPSMIPAYNDNSLKTDKPCESTSKDAPETDKTGTRPPVSCSLYLVSGDGDGAQPLSKPEVQNDTPQTPGPRPLDPVSCHAWETFRSIWTPALQNGKFIDEDACREKWAKMPAMSNQWIAAAKNYVVSKRVRDGFPMNPMKFLSGAWRDWQTPETPSGPAGAEPDFSWREERDRDEAQFAEEQKRRKRPRDKLPFETEAEYEAKRQAGELMMVVDG